MNKIRYFKYWFNHWFTYQLVAILHHCWRFRFLFHDIEKPWLNLFWTKAKVKDWQHNRHHIIFTDNPDYLGDWECARFTKSDKPLTARQLFHKDFENKLWANHIAKEIEIVLDKYNFY